MEITLDARNYGYDIIVKAENVNISEDIESRTYPKDENGKTIFSNPIRDISTESLDMISRLLGDMIYYRQAKYDSSDLIKRLFEKLPNQSELSFELFNQYKTDEE